MKEGEEYILEVEGLKENPEQYTTVLEKMLNIFHGEIVKVTDVFNINDYVEIRPQKNDYPIMKVHKSWLKPIEKDEFEEWSKQFMSNTIVHFPETILKLCHEWTKENERKKYQPLIDYINKIVEYGTPRNILSELKQILKDLKIEWR